MQRKKFHILSLGSAEQYGKQWFISAATLGELLQTFAEEVPVSSGMHGEPADIGWITAVELRGCELWGTLSLVDGGLELLNACERSSACIELQPGSSRLLSVQLMKDEGLLDIAGHLSTIEDA
jgi:hypothetical protein